MRSMLSVRQGFWLSTLICTLVTPAIAWAGPTEEFKQLALHPTRPEIMALRYSEGNGGLFMTEDSGMTWKMMCASMIAPGYNMQSGASISIASDGTMLTASFDGVWEGKAGGCTWALAPDVKLPVRDVTRDPRDPSVMYTVTAGGNDGTRNAVWRRDSGGSWSPLGEDAPTLLSRIRVVELPDGGLRLYESGQRAMGPQMMPQAPQRPEYLIRVSDDLGKTWREHMFESSIEGSLRLEAVDPTQPDRIIAVVENTGTGDVLLLSDDQGQTFREYLTVTEFGGVSFAPDGRVWIADRGDASNLSSPKGLWAAPDLSAAPTAEITDYGVWCVTYQPTTERLYMCQRWYFGTFDAQSKSFAPTFDFTKAKEFISCPGVDGDQVCKAQLCSAYCGPRHYATSELCSRYNEPECGIPAAAQDRVEMDIASGTPPVGTAAAGAGAMAPAPSAPPASDGCSAGGAPGPDAATALLLAIGLAARYRRRRRD